MDPEDILLPEIWGLVFDKLEEPQDWLNLYRASPHFQGIVGGKKDNALLTKVFPPVFKHLTKSDILATRRVSKPWKRTVDKMLENSVSVDRFRHRELERIYTLKDSAGISSFLDRFEAHSGNPFVGRFAYLKVDRNLGFDAIVEHNNLATRLLDKFGAQLKTLCVDILHTNSDNGASRLRGFLRMTPNLDGLNVHCVNRDQGGAEVLIPHDEMGPLPPLLRNLKQIWLTGEGFTQRREVLQGLHNAMVRLSCNPNSLKSLSTTGVLPEMLAFPNVNSADVVLSDLEDCLSLARAPWPLSKLTLKHSHEIPLERLFQSIEHFRATLTFLKFHYALLRTHHANLTLDLPHLTELALEEDPRMSLHFVTNLNNLEVLTIRSSRHWQPYPEDDETNNLMQTFVEWAQGEVAQWGLWEGLPRLTKISLIGPNMHRNRIVGGVRVVDIPRHVATRNNPEFRRLQDQYKQW